MVAVCLDADADACCVAQAFGAGGLTGAEARAHRRARMALLELLAAYLVSSFEYYFWHSSSFLFSLYSISYSLRTK